jgi:hypothetical protein
VHWRKSWRSQGYSAERQSEGWAKSQRGFKVTARTFVFLEGMGSNGGSVAEGDSPALVTKDLRVDCSGEGRPREHLESY